ncbi:hypothetical protein AK88_02216 [Plasmodium fragile]|uniref:Uncharacterized protein n=1 Tax=Plasmodium fragile TaxID=5857 RepID=A0A0D9QMW0_PLAFR|nr:uncharacterized protein AK88_02216 [Plasmodium fragile]KJP88102.1 hypothetical protein AK88_02216 [Plasmodium fragile]
MSRFSFQKIVFNDNKLLKCENAPKDNVASFKSLTTSQFRSDQAKSGFPHERVGNTKLKCAPNSEDKPNGASQQKCADHRSGPPALNSAQTLEDNKNRGYINLIKKNVKNVISNIINRKSILGRKNNEDVREDKKKKAGEVKNKGQNSNAALNKERNTSVALSKIVENPDTDATSPDLKSAPKGIEKKGENISNAVRSNHEIKSSVRKTWINLKNVDKGVANNDAKNDDSKVNLRAVAKDMVDQSNGGMRELSGRGTPTNEKNRGVEKVSHGDGSRTNRSSKATPLTTKPFILGIKKNEKIPNKQNAFTSRTTHNKEKYIGRSTSPSFLHNDSFKKNLKKTLIETIMNPDKVERTPELAAVLRTTPRTTPAKVMNRSGHPDLLRRDTMLNKKGSPHGEKTKSVIKYPSPINANSAKAISLHMKGGSNLFETKQEIVRRYSTAVRNRNSVLRKNIVTKNRHLSFYKLNGEGNEKKKLSPEPNDTPKMVSCINHAQAPDRKEWSSSREDGIASPNNISPISANCKNKMASKMFPLQRKKIDGVANSVLKNGRLVKDTSPTGGDKYKNSFAPKQGTQPWGLHKRVVGNNDPSRLHMPKRSGTTNFTMVNKECSVPSRILKRFDSVSNGQVKKGVDLKTGHKLGTGIKKKHFFPVDNMQKVSHQYYGLPRKGISTSEVDKCVGGDVDDERGYVPIYAVKGEQSSGEVEQSAREMPLEGGDQSDATERHRGEALLEEEAEKSAILAEHTPGGVVTGDEVYYDSSAVNSAQTKYRETDLYEDFNDSTMMVLRRNLDYEGETSSCVTPTLVTRGQDNYHVDTLYNCDNLSAQCVKIENVSPYERTECGCCVGEPAYEVENVDTQKGTPNGGPEEAEPDEEQPNEDDEIGSSPMAQSDILTDDELVDEGTEKISGMDVRANHQSDWLRTLLGGEVAQLWTAEETLKGEVIGALESEKDKVNDSDSEFITLVQEENFLKDHSSDNVISHVKTNNEKINIPVKEEQNGHVTIRGDCRDMINEQGNDYDGENGGVAEIGHRKKNDYVCIRVESEDEDVITESVKIYLKSKSQEDGFKDEWGGASCNSCVISQSVKNDENISAQVNIGHISKLAVSHDRLEICSYNEGSKTGEVIIREGHAEAGSEKNDEERMMLQGQNKEESLCTQRSGDGKGVLPPRETCMEGGTEPPETHPTKQLPSRLREHNNTPQNSGGKKSVAHEKSSVICGDEQSSKGGSHFKAAQICGKHFSRTRHKMVRTNSMHNFSSKYKKNYNLSLHNRKVKERKVANDAGKNEQLHTHAKGGVSGEGIILAGEAYPCAQQGNVCTSKGVADQLCSGKKRKIDKLMISFTTPSRVLKKKKTKPTSPMRGRSTGGLKCRVRKSRGGGDNRKRTGKELRSGEEVANAADVADAPAAHHAESVFREHEWMGLILQIIDNDNFELAQKLMLLIFEKEEELYVQFVDAERSDTSTCADSSPLGEAGEPKPEDAPKNSNVYSRGGAPKQRGKKVSHYMEQIVHSCPSDWPLLDIAILIIVSQIVCYIFTHNKWKYFFQSCTLFEKFCIPILLNSSIINAEKNGIPILMFEHDFFFKILITENGGELSSTAMKYRCEHLRNDHVGKEMTILDLIFLALGSYITVSQNINEYVERNNLEYYVDLFRKRASEGGVQEDRRKRRKRKLLRVSSEMSRDSHHPSKLSKRQTRAGGQRRTSNHSNYSKKKQRFSEPLHQNKTSEEQYLCERTKRRRMTYEKNVKRRLSILRTTKCITAVDKHSMCRRSAYLDTCHGKEKIPTADSDNRHENNKMAKLFLFRNKKIENIVQYHTRSDLEKMLCHIVIEIFNLVYAFREFSVENILIIRKFFRVFLNFAQKRFIGLSVRAYCGGSGEVNSATTANVRAVVPPPQRIYDNYYNLWIWVDRIFSQNFYELNNLLYDVGLQKNSLLEDHNLTANYTKIETISKNVKRFSALQRRNCSVLRRYWGTFGSKEGIAANGDRDVDGVVCHGGDAGSITVPRSPLETSMEEGSTGLVSHEWLPNGELDKEHLRKHRILCKLEKRDHSKDRLAFHFLNAVESIYHVYHSMEEIPSFLHLKKKKYFSTYMGSSETENGRGSTGIPFLNRPINEKCDMSTSYSSPSQVMILLNHHMDGSNNYENGVNAPLGMRTSGEAVEDNSDHWIRQLKRRLKIYDIQWHEEYEKQYVNLANSMKMLKKKFTEKKLFCKIMESDINSIWLDKNQVYLQYIQIMINCKFILGSSYDEIFQFIKGNYGFVFNMVEEMRRGLTGCRSPPSEGKRRRKFQDDNFLLMAWEIANFYFCILYYKFELREILQELLKWISIFGQLEEGAWREGSLLMYRQRCVSYTAHILIFLNEYTCAQRVLKQFSREFLRNVRHGQRQGVRENDTPLGSDSLGGKPLEPHCSEQSRAAILPTCKRIALHAHTINKCYLYDKWINFMIRKYNRLIPFLLKKKNIVKLILFNNKNVKILLKKKKEKVITKKVMSKMQQLQKVVLSLYCLCVKLYKSYYDHASILHFKTAQQLLVASKYLGIRIKEREVVVTNYCPSEGADGAEVKMGKTLLNELPYHGASNNFLSADGGENLFSGCSFGDAMNASPVGGRAASEWASPGLYLRAESSTPYVSPYRGKTDWEDEGQNKDDMFYLHALVLSIQIQYTLSVCIIICADLFIYPAKLNRLAGGKRANKDPPAMSKTKHPPLYVPSLFNCKILRKHYRVINGHDFVRGGGSNEANRGRKKKKKKKKLVSCGGLGLSGHMHMYYVNYVGGGGSKGNDINGNHIKGNDGGGFPSGGELQTGKKVICSVHHGGKWCNHGEGSYVGDGPKDSPTEFWQDHQWSNQPDRDCLSDVVMEKTHDSLEGELVSAQSGWPSDRLNGYLSECLPGRYENFKRSIVKKRGSNLNVRDGRLRDNGGDCTVRTSEPDPVDTKNSYHILVQISTWLSKNSAAQLAWIGQKLFKMCLPELLCIVLALQANMFMGKNILTNIKRIDRILKLCAESPQLVYFAAESLKNHTSKANRKTYKNYFSIGKRYKEIFVKRKRDVIDSKEELFQLCRYFLPCDEVDKENNHNSAV